MNTLNLVRIIDQGRGPQIEGTRVSVYLIWEFLRSGAKHGDIASAVGLTGQQVQAAIDYIDVHHDDIEREFAKIESRIQRGNPPWIEQRLQRNGEKLRQWKAEQRALAEQDS